MGAVALGMASGRARGLPISVIGYSEDPPCTDTGALRLRATRPIADLDRLPASTMVGGFPFAPGFTGDDFENTQIPFHTVQNDFPGGQPPAPTEEVSIAIVGGGLSGLATAYHLRRHRPVVFELHDRFGGNSQGEEWMGTKYSMGGAYFIAPDEGSSLARLYRQLGATRSHRLDSGGNPMELNGQVVTDFWSGEGRSPEERAALARYAEIVSHFANEKYPDIPLVDGLDNAWILEMDAMPFRADLEARMGMAIPPILASAIQAYFYSSFDAGWEEVSAAAGWNFVAAEEYGRWVCPGGNSFLVDALWRELSELDRGVPARCPGRHLRGRCRVVDVRFVPGDRVQVTYKDSEGVFRSLLARRVVMACPKHVAKHIVQGIDELDPEKMLALGQLNTRAYLVANVLLNDRLGREFYDLFRLGDGTGYPMSEGEAEATPFAPDVIDAKFGDPGGPRRSVLTVYWSIPYYHGRFHLIFPNGWQTFADRLAPQLETLLQTLGVDRRLVRQVRMTRWGHSMPIAAVGFLATGLAELVRRPIRDRVFFVNQDNWALPAVETCLLEAEAYAPLIEAGL
jgi:hypothetical protein